MKKILTTILILSLSVIAFAEPIKNTFIQKFISMDAKSVLSDEETINPVLQSGFRHFRDYREDTIFRWIYTSARRTLFQLIGLNDLGDGDYNVVRTIILSKMKEYLHADNNIKDIFDVYRPFIKAQIKKLSQEEKAEARVKIQDAIDTFKLLKTRSIKKKFKDFVNAGEFNRGDYGGETLLSKNLSSAETIEALLSDDNTVGVDISGKSPESMFTKIFEDHHLAKFAGRRMMEGGDELLDKYIVILLLLLEDVGSEEYIEATSEIGQ